MLYRPEDLVLYSDDDLLAVNKPAGLRTLPDGYDPSQPHVKSVFEPQFGRLWIVHRLDRDTSGVLLLARSAAVHRNLNTQFAQHQVIKTYHALCRGAPEWERRQVERRLLADGDRRHRTVVDDERGKYALTDLRILERLGEFSWIEAAPHTGRTHQVRAHLAAEGLPILGDELYGGEKWLYLSQIKGESSPSGETPLLERVALHAWALSFDHPITRQGISIQADYPDDLNTALQALRRYCQPAA